MEERYIRNTPALTEGECALLREKRVLILGLGGLGGHLLELLLRVGVGTLRVCDGDVFEAANLNRQLLSDCSRLGTAKTAAAAEHAQKVNPGVQLEVWEGPMTAENADALVAGCDAVLDGLDSIGSRKILAAACSRAGIPYVFGAVGGWVAQAAVIMPGDGLLDILYPEDTEPEEKSVLAVTPALGAAVQAALCIRLLAGRPVEAGKLYHMDLLNMEWEALELAAWQN